MAEKRRAQGAGSVYMRKDGRAAASAMYEGKRITKYGKTKKEAWDNLQASLDDLKQGKAVTGPKQTVKQYLEFWLENVHRLKIELTTLDQYRTALRIHLIPAFGYLPLASLTRERIQQFYVEKLESGLGARRVVFLNAILSAALKHAVVQRVLAQNPCEYVTLPKLRKHKPHVLTSDEARRLVAAARGHRLWFMLLIGLTTGARIGELCALHWEDIDVDARRIHIHRNRARVKGLGFIEKRPKSESGSRKVVLAQVVIDGIDEQRAFIAKLRVRASARWSDLDLVFPNRHGSYLDSKYVLHQFQELLADAGLDKRVLHDLRHSAATLLFAAGVNAKVVQEALGHSSIAITLGMYGDVMPDMQQGVADVMDNIFK